MTLPSMRIIDVRREKIATETYRPLWLKTERGEIACRLYEVKDSERAALWVGGVGGGWDTPARGLYPSLAEDLCTEGISSLRVRYRYSQKLADAVYDVKAGIAFLQGEGIDRIALIGHSLGGAVVIQAGAGNPDVRTIVTIAAMSYATELAAELLPTTSLLLLHGGADTVLPASCSKVIHDRAMVYKRMTIYPHAGHMLDEAADEVRQAIRGWLTEELFE